MMEEKRLTCYITSLALNNSLVEIEKDKGLDYAEDCCSLLKHADYYLTDTKSKNRFYTCDLATFIDAFKDAVQTLPSTEYACMLPEKPLSQYLETITEYATKISKEGWVSEWSRDVTAYFQKMSHLVAYAHEKISKKLTKEHLEDPTVVISAPMPFGMLREFYDESSDLLVFLTTGLKPRPILYEARMLREPKEERSSDSYEGYGFPRKHYEMVYEISHEVAHRCLHLTTPSEIDLYLHGKLLEEEICRMLALEVMMARTSFDRKLRKKDVYRMLGRELFL